MGSISTEKAEKSQPFTSSDEVAQYLKRYFEERTAQDLDLQQEPALFLSLRKQRIAVRSVEYLVKNTPLLQHLKENHTPQVKKQLWICTLCKNQ